MRIAYLIHLNLGENSGALRKIAEQLSAWRENGHECQLFALTPGAPTPQSANLGAVDQQYHSRVSHARASLALVDSIVSWGPDLLYMRHGLYNPGYRRVMSTIPTVIEINTDDVAELWSNHQYAYSAYNLATRRAVLCRAAGAVFVTNELACDARFASAPLKRLVLANGIDLSSIEPQTSGPPDSTPQLVFVSSPGFHWHGIDKILWLAQRRPRWKFHIIGSRLVDLPGGSLPARNVHCHGHLPPSDYASLMRNGHVAIGTLALHRIGMHEACPLKVREYLAYGLPTIVGYADTDFLKGAPFILRLPNREDNVQLSLVRIDEFVARSLTMRAPRSRLSHLDSRYKEELRLVYFDAVVGSQRPAASRVPPG